MTQKIKRSSGKAKGRKLQQWVCEKISYILELPWGPDELIASRPMSQGGVDIVLKGKARKMFPFAVECKRQEAWSVPQWVEQARKNAEKGQDWLLFMKKNLRDPVVVMDANAFFRMMENIIEFERVSQ